MPENEPARIQAAEAFELAGDAKKAEQQYRILLQRNPNSSAAHFFLARFLGQDKSRKDEALREADAALKLSDRPNSPPREKIQALISAISSGTSGRDELKL
jgi:tetratricopeptide (TPR) repeat protein